MAVPQLIRSLGGITTAGTLASRGVTRSALARLVNSGVLLRPRPGVFAVPETAEDVLTAAAHGGLLTCSSALSRRGVWVLENSCLHVWLGRGLHARPHPECTCVSHRFVGRAGVGVVPLELALAHLRRCAGDEAFFASLESVLNRQLLSAAGLQRLRRLLPGCAHWMLDFAVKTSDSGLESLLRFRLHALGLSLRVQVCIGGLSPVDFVIGDRVILEADGKLNHASESKRHKDLVRDATTSRLGYETLRFDYAQIIHDWPTVQAAILAALARH